MLKFIQMVGKLLYRYLESVLLTFVPTVPTRELSRHFMSLTLQHRVIDAATSCILGKSTSESLCILTVLQPTRSERISTLANSDFEYRLNSLLREYKDIFEGTIALKNVELTIQIDPSVHLCVQKPRRLPFLMKKQIEAEIQKLLDQDFIEPLNSSPEWVSPLVCVPKKNGDVRLCVDMRKANTAIIRNYYPIPTLDEILYEVNGAKIFSKICKKSLIKLFLMKNQETLQVLVLLKDYFDDKIREKGLKLNFKKF